MVPTPVGLASEAALHEATSICVNLRPSAVRIRFAACRVVLSFIVRLSRTTEEGLAEARSFVLGLVFHSWSLFAAIPSLLSA